MFVFPKQSAFNVGGVVVGGQVNVPCVLIGTIFYDRENILAKDGSFDRKKASALISSQDALAEETGMPCMLDVYAHDAGRMVERLSYCADESPAPLLVDSTEASARLAGVRHAQEAGFSDRIAYNSLNAGATQDEVDALCESDVDAAILLAFNPVDSGLNGRLSMLDDGAGVLPEGLLSFAEKAGIKKPLIDTGITPLGEGAASALRAVPALKARYGLPTGNGIHNVVLSWRWLERQKDNGFADVTASCLTRLLGGDFVLYGPIESARRVYTSMALTDALISEAGEELGLKSKGGPYGRLL